MKRPNKSFASNISTTGTPKRNEAKFLSPSSDIISFLQKVQKVTKGKLEALNKDSGARHKAYDSIVWEHWKKMKKFALDSELFPNGWETLSSDKQFDFLEGKIRGDANHEGEIPGYMDKTVFLEKTFPQIKKVFAENVEAYRFGEYPEKKGVNLIEFLVVMKHVLDVMCEYNAEFKLYSFVSRVMQACDKEVRGGDNAPSPAGHVVNLLYFYGGDLVNHNWDALFTAGHEEKRESSASNFASNTGTTDTPKRNEAKLLSPSSDIISFLQAVQNVTKGQVEALRESGARYTAYDSIVWKHWKKMKKLLPREWKTFTTIGQQFSFLEGEIKKDRNCEGEIPGYMDKTVFLKKTFPQIKEVFTENVEAYRSDEYPAEEYPEKKGVNLIEFLVVMKHVLDVMCEHNAKFKLNSFVSRVMRACDKNVRLGDGAPSPAGHVVNLLYYFGQDLVAHNWDAFFAAGHEEKRESSASNAEKLDLHDLVAHNRNALFTAGGDEEKRESLASNAEKLDPHGLV